ncbi:MAG: mechanosensitive ion channel family protein [Clostridiaceae bacterium]
MLLSNIFNIDVNDGGIKIGNIPIPIAGLVTFGTKVLKAALIIFTMFILMKILWKVIDKWAEKQGNMRLSLDENMSKTVAVIMKSILRYFIYFVGIMAIFTEFFGTISVTMAGIGGVALGFGSQNLVKDIINGFFILFEGQYVVGDHIEVDTKIGVVESIELRVTRIRDFNGALHIIPNGSITRVTNHSKGPKRIQVDVNIAYSEDIERTIEVINGVCDNFAKDNEDIEEKPKVAGVTELGVNGVNIRIAGKAKPLTQWAQENELRKMIKLELDKANIEIPYSKFNVISEKDINQ